MTINFLPHIGKIQTGLTLAVTCCPKLAIMFKVHIWAKSLTNNCLISHWQSLTDLTLADTSCVKLSIMFNVHIWAKSLTNNGLKSNWQSFFVTHRQNPNWPHIGRHLLPQIGNCVQSTYMSKKPLPIMAWYHIGNHFSHTDPGWPVTKSVIP